MGRLILVFVTVLFSFQSYAQPYDTINVVTGWNLIGSLAEGAT